MNTPNTAHKTNPSKKLLQISQEVAEALEHNRPVVALESTVYSTLGLPSPHNREVFDKSHQVITERNATACVTSVINGQYCLGVENNNEIDLLLGAEQKVSTRELAIAKAQRWKVGVTTVGASLALANAGGIDVFATGGIGGVHRESYLSGDVSNDLTMLASHPIVTVCAGAKAFLDLPQTFERLETLGVIVLGYQCDTLPAFTAASSGIASPHRVETAEEVAEILIARREFNQGGVLVCATPPQPLDSQELDQANEQAEALADQAGVVGAKRTPFLLAAIAEITEGRSVAANTALVENNACIAADIAVAIKKLEV